MQQIKDGDLVQLNDGRLGIITSHIVILDGKTMYQICLAEWMVYRKSSEFAVVA